MDTTQRNYRSQVEINDLVDEAVKNSVARRNQAMDSADALSNLSDEQAGTVTGGGKAQDLIALGGVLVGGGSC